MGEEDACLSLETDGRRMMDENCLKNESKRSNEWVVDVSVFETPNKKPAKEISVDESVSEVLNPNVSPPENASSSQTVSSKPVDLIVRPDSGEIPTTSTANSSTDVVGNGDQCIINTLASVPSSSEVVFEGSKSSGTCGIKRIRFTFSKSKDRNNGRSYSESRGLDMMVATDTSSNQFHAEDEPSSSELVYSSENMLQGRYAGVFYGMESHTTKNKMVMSKKGSLHSHITNVKDLLLTGILEGANVTYMKRENELLYGIISGLGYLRGCARCKYSKVLSASQFEQHAGSKSRHPNDHIVLNNGKTLHGIVQELQNTPPSSLDEQIRALSGSSVDEQSYFVCQGLLVRESHQQSEGKGCKDDNYQFDYNKCFQSMTRSKKSSQSCSMNSPTSKSVVLRKHTTPGRHKKRDNDLHRSVFSPIGLPDGADLAYCSKGQEVLKGYKQGDGIFCSCCNCKISPSSFEAHAGWASRRQPYRHIYTSNGVSLHDLSISLANAQSLDIINAYDMCKMCGDGGGLDPLCWVSSSFSFRAIAKHYSHA